MENLGYEVKYFVRRFILNIYRNLLFHLLGWESVCRIVNMTVRYRHAMPALESLQRPFKMSKNKFYNFIGRL